VTRDRLFKNAVYEQFARMGKGLSSLKRLKLPGLLCRGSYCIPAIEAVEKLRARGYRFVLAEEGVHEWRALGFALETAGED